MKNLIHFILLPLKGLLVSSRGQLLLALIGTTLIWFKEFSFIANAAPYVFPLRPIGWLLLIIALFLLCYDKYTTFKAYRLEKMNIEASLIKEKKAAETALAKKIQIMSVEMSLANPEQLEALDDLVGNESIRYFEEIKIFPLAKFPIYNQLLVSFIVRGYIKLSSHGYTANCLACIDKELYKLVIERKTKK